MFNPFKGLMRGQLFLGITIPSVIIGGVGLGAKIGGVIGAAIGRVPQVLDPSLLGQQALL